MQQMRETQKEAGSDSGKRGKKKGGDKKSTDTLSRKQSFDILPRTTKKKKNQVEYNG